MPLWLVLCCFVIFVIRLRNTRLSSLLAWHSSAQNKIIHVFNWLSFVCAIKVWRGVRFENFTIVLVSAALFRLFPFHISIVESLLVWSSRRFWHVSELLIAVVCLVVSLAIAGAFRSSLPRVVSVYCFFSLLVSWWHSLFQKLQTASSFFDVLTAIIGRNHTTVASLGRGITVSALRPKTALVPWLVVVLWVTVLVVVHATVTLIWKVVPSVVTCSNTIVLDCMKLPIHVTLLRSQSQTSSHQTLVICGFTLAILLWDLLTHKLIWVVVILCFCDRVIAAIVTYPSGRSNKKESNRISLYSCSCATCRSHGAWRWYWGCWF